MKLLRPPALKFGDTIGVFTPSWPAHILLREKYVAGLKNLASLGFKIKEGSLTMKSAFQGYRSGSPEERADEFMELIVDPEVRCIMSVIGGHNTSSLLPFLDFETVRLNPKVICGYSDLTALELGLLKGSGMCCFYGPAVVPSFGEPRRECTYTQDWFISSVMNTAKYPLRVQPPVKWSDQFIDARCAEWDKVNRVYQHNEGWIVQRSGVVDAPILPANLDTLLALAGTQYFPDLENCILMIEEMAAPFDRLERNLSHLNLLGVFEKISGLIVSKSEHSDSQGAPFTESELLMDFVGDRSFPIISNFDCGHTVPMLTLQLMTRVRINAQLGEPPIIELLEPMVC